MSDMMKHDEIALVELDTTEVDGVVGASLAPYVIRAAAVVYYLYRKRKA
ncbi:MAG: hypothetical protein ACK5JR_16005 [Tropicimonas sp.]